VDFVRTESVRINPYANYVSHPATDRMCRHRNAAHNSWCRPDGWALDYSRNAKLYSRHQSGDWDAVTTESVRTVCHTPLVACAPIVALPKATTECVRRARQLFAPRPYTPLVSVHTHTLAHCLPSRTPLLIKRVAHTARVWA
jgi:hypothetical protein